jgi:quinol monooxygenase YgiN
MAVTYFVRMRALDGREEAVRDLLLSNVAKIDGGERGNVVFAVHASNQDPREFWLYGTWTDPEAVETHESGPAFNAYGNAPTGEQGTMSETHAVRLRDGRIVVQFVGDNNFSMPHQELVTWAMDFPRDTPDPSPVLTEARRDAQPTM